MKDCPFCAEQIQDRAIKCKHCGSMLNEPPQAIPAHPPQATPVQRTPQRQPEVTTDKFRITEDRYLRQVILGTLGMLVLGIVTCFLEDEGEIIFGILFTMILGGVAIIRTIKCQYCGKKTQTSIIHDQVKCPRCEVVHLITWTWD